MSEEENTQAQARAGVFFERAEEVVQTNNFDYAIDLYTEGLRCDPEALHKGHMKLYELALHRRERGGKKPSMMEVVKRLHGKKTPLEQMLNAENLFAKDPTHRPYAEEMLKAALEGDYKITAKWIADLVLQMNNAAKKPSLQTYLLLKNSYEAIGELQRAIIACEGATRLKHDDPELADEYKRLSTELTVSTGKYDLEGDFRKSIKDREAQEKLQAQASVVKPMDYRLVAVEEARREFARDPNLPKNIYNLAKALAGLENDQGQAEAIELLEKIYERKKDFSFKSEAGLIKISNLKQKIRKAKAALETNPDDTEAKAQLSELFSQLNITELEHYRLSVENYPTDLPVKYEYGVRLLYNKRYDEAIPLLQEAQKDPRRKIPAMDKIGLCFFNKGWFTDAIDIFIQAINLHEIKDDSIAKELRYNLALSYEHEGESEKALELYRKIAQIDFGYKDVCQRVDKLRSRKTEPTSQ